MSKSVIIDSYKGADESLEGSLEEFIEASPEENLEENIIESTASEEQTQDESKWNCHFLKNRKFEFLTRNFNFPIGNTLENPDLFSWI